MDKNLKDDGFEEEFDDDLENAFGEEEDEFEDDDAPAKEVKDDTKDKKEKSEKDKKKSPPSAVFQKIKLREQLKEAKQKLALLEESKKEDKNLSEEEKKELAARDYLEKTIKEIFEKVEAEKSNRTLQEQEDFEDELDEVVAESDYSREDILDVCEELDISPLRALKVLERESKSGKKEKPKVPQPKRASPELKEDTPKKEGERLTFDSAARAIKEKMKKGLL